MVCADEDGQCSKPAGTGSSDLTAKKGIAMKASNQSFLIVCHLKIFADNVDFSTNLSVYVFRLAEEVNQSRTG